MTPTTDRLRDLIQHELRELIEIRHDLHAHPELGYQENRTSGVVRRELEKAGIEFKGGLAGGTGILAHLADNGGGAIGLRADMDATMTLLEVDGSRGKQYRIDVLGDPN